jgi:hypothetical protein
MCVLGRHVVIRHCMHLDRRRVVTHSRMCLLPLYTRAHTKKKKKIVLVI